MKDVYKLLMITSLTALYTYAENTIPYSDIAYIQLGKNFEKNNLLAQAYASYEHALVLSTDFEIIFNIGNEFFKRGEFRKALRAYKKSYTLNNNVSQTHFNTGLCYSHMNKHVQAVKWFDQALVLNPRYFKALVEKGNALSKLQQPEEALTCYQQALALNDRNADLHHQTGKIYRDQRNLDQAIHHFQTAYELDSQNTSILLDLANALNMQEYTDQALELYQRLLTLTSRSPSILYNIAYTLKKQGNIEQALKYYDEALQKDPDNAEAHFSLSLAHLISGDFERGWAEYEWRWSRPGRDTYNLKKPQWDGTSSLEGKTILLYAEQGLGDALQFIRYAREVKRYGGTVIASVHPPLVQLFSLCPYIDKVIGLHDPTPHHDVQAALMSLPYLLKTTIDTVPNEVPYLYAQPELIEEWKAILSQDQKLRIGICWQGNSNYSTPFLKHVVAAKSLDLINFAPIAQLPHVQLYSLQKVTGIEQLAHAAQELHLIDFGPNLDQQHGRFMDTVAIMKNLDLIITIDTSIAHLAGGLGVPVWVLIPNPPDWRWLLNRSDTPWYPNMRLFRQPTPGDWQSVIHMIKEEVIALI